MINYVVEKNKCTGCSACSKVCPKSAIHMQKDEEGFFYPVITNECVECGACKKVCPVLNKHNNISKNKHNGYIARSLDNTVWETSSSGGVFYEVAASFLKRYNSKSKIYAARFDGFSVVHDFFTNINEIEPFQKSKYIQSDISNVYKEIKEDLENGTFVLFVGTPCQNAALRNYLRIDYQNYYSIDFACHGVGSPLIFESFIKYLEKKYKKKIVKYTFRNKKKLINYERYQSKIVFFDGCEKTLNNDEYNRLFLKQLITRTSCQECCQFRTLNRFGDITISDLNNKMELFPDIYDERNLSAIMINNEKGKFLFKEASENLYFRQCDIETIKKSNPILYKNAPGNKQRYSFFQDFNNDYDFSYLANKYSPKKLKIINLFQRYIPWKIKYLLYRLVRIIKL